MRCELIAELATNHAGDIGLATEMIWEAAAAGADYVKTQGYQIKHLPPTDAQYQWLQQCELSDEQHKTLMAEAAKAGVEYMSTAFTQADAIRFGKLGIRHLKIGSGESRRSQTWRYNATGRIFVSIAWGRLTLSENVTVMATVPIYPMPDECFARVEWTAGMGWSDHAVGLTVAKIAIARGAVCVEKHFSLPGRGRNQAWDMTPTMLRELRQWAEACQPCLDGSRYEGRWRA